MKKLADRRGCFKTLSTYQILHIIRERNSMILIWLKYFKLKTLSTPPRRLSLNHLHIPWQF